MIKLEVVDDVVKINGTTMSNVEYIDLILVGVSDAELLIRYYGGYSEHYHNDETEFEISLIHKDFSLFYDASIIDILIQKQRLKNIYELTYNYVDKRLPEIGVKMYA